MHVFWTDDAHRVNTNMERLGHKLDADLVLHLVLQNVFWVSAINTGFIFLAMFHLAYLGLMFGVQDTDDQTLAAEVCPL